LKEVALASLPSIVVLEAAAQRLGFMPVACESGVQSPAVSRHRHLNSYLLS
jgi:hypothetical protein